MFQKKVINTRNTYFTVVRKFILNVEDEVYCRIMVIDIRNASLPAFNIIKLFPRT